MSLKQEYFYTVYSTWPLTPLDIWIVPLGDLAKTSGRVETSAPRPSRVHDAGRSSAQSIAMVAGATTALIVSLAVSASARVCHADALQRLRDEDLARFLQTFVAAHASDQDECVAAMNGSRYTGSQFGQALLVWRNFFAARAAAGRRGFYVESGANKPKTLSNTWFFDRCLGWAGLCVEPNPMYHAALRKERTCTVVPECLSARPARLGMRFSGVITSVKESSGHKVDCNPLDVMLQRVGQTRVDFWSMDLEGYERIVINSTDFGHLEVGVLLVEDFHLSNRELDLLMARKGFLKAMQLPHDSVYVSRQTRVCWPSDFWEPPIFDQWWRGEARYRVGLRSRGQLANDLR